MIYLEDSVTERERSKNRKTGKYSIHWLIAQVTTVEPGVLNSILVSYIGGRSPDNQTIFHCSTKHISKELNWKWSSQLINQCWYAMLPLKWWFNSLCHNAAPAAFFSWKNLCVYLKGRVTYTEVKTETDKCNTHIYIHTSQAFHLHYSPNACTNHSWIGLKECCLSLLHRQQGLK